MIVSASRRTDIPAFYSRWFFNRLRQGYVLVRNPAAPRRISRISLGPEDVIVPRASRSLRSGQLRFDI